MKFEVKTLISGGEAESFTETFTEVLSSISGLSEGKIESYFVSKAVGAKSKSLASTVRNLVLNDLQLKGWTINWSPFGGFTEYESAIWNFDAAKLLTTGGTNGWVTLEISFDNRVAIGTHLVKATVANNAKFRKSSGAEHIFHHIIVAASKSFKAVAGIDNSVASAEEFEIASGPYSALDLVGTTLVSLNALEKLEVLQRKSDGRTKSKLLNLETN
jgi:hypothetical protein